MVSKERKKELKAKIIRSFASWGEIMVGNMDVENYTEEEQKFLVKEIDATSKLILSRTDKKTK